MKKLVIAYLASFYCAFTQIFAQEKRTLSLGECIEIAVENNLTIRRSQLSLETFRVNLRQAKGRRYPTVSMNGRYGLNWGRAIDPTTNQFTTQRINFNGVGGNGNLTLFQGLQISNGIKQGKLNVEAGQYDVQKAINDVSLSIALTYLNVILNKELLENASFQLESSEQQLARTKKLVASGALPISNELQIASQVATNEVGVINAENNLDLAMLSLKQALLLPSDEQIDIVAPEIEVDGSEIVLGSVAEAYQMAVASQPEIRSADLKLQSASTGLKVSRGAIYPTLTLSGGFNTNFSGVVTERFVPDGTPGTVVMVPTNLTTAIGDVPIIRNMRIPGGKIEDYDTFDQWKDNLSQSISLNVSIPIFTGFRTLSNIQRSEINVRQAEISAIEQRNTLYQSVESAYRSALAASKTYAASQKQVAALEETFRTVENQYNLGAVNFTDYQVAGNNLFRARSDLARAKYDFVFRKKVLDFYQGKSLSF